MCCGSWFDDAITLSDRKGYNPAERVISNQIHNQRWVGFVWSNRAKEFAPETRKALANTGVCGIPSQSCVRAEQLGHSPVKGNSSGLSMLWLREYDVGGWYEASSIPAHWFVTDGQLQQMQLALECMCTCHLIYFGIVIVGRCFNLERKSYCCD